MAEIYFIGGMFVLIIIICTITMVFFTKTYRKEQREKLARKAEKEKRKMPDKNATHV